MPFVFCMSNESCILELFIGHNGLCDFFLMTKIKFLLRTINYVKHSGKMLSFRYENFCTLEQNIIKKIPLCSKRKYRKIFENIFVFGFRALAPKILNFYSFDRESIDAPTLSSVNYGKPFNELFDVHGQGKHQYREAKAAPSCCQWSS